MTTDNNHFAMLTLHANQTEIWADTLWLDISRLKVDVTFKNKRLDLKDKTAGFNKYVSRELKNNEAHAESSAAISKLCELLAKSSADEGGKIIEAIVYVARNSEVIYPEDVSEKHAMLDKLKLISELSDRLVAFSLKDLKQFHKQVINAPLKQ